MVVRAPSAQLQGVDQGSRRAEGEEGRLLLIPRSSSNVSPASLPGEGEPGRVVGRQAEPPPLQRFVRLIML